MPIHCIALCVFGRRVTHPELPAEVADGGARFGLADGVHDLLLRKLRSLHGSAPFVRDHRSAILLQFQNAVVFRGDVNHWRTTQAIGLLNLFCYTIAMIGEEIKLCQINST